MFECSENMLPRSSLDDGIYASCANTIFARQFRLFNPAPRVSCTNLFDLYFGQARMPLPFSLPQTVTLESIVRVVLECSNFQMVGPYARSLIAFVTDDQTFRHWPVMQFIRKHVSTNLILLLAKAKELILAIDSIPEPATIAFDDVLPEPFNWRATVMGILTSLAAMAATAIGDAGLYRRKRLAAVLTYARNATRRLSLFHARLAAILASPIVKAERRDGECAITILASDGNSGRMWLTHESKLLFSICVQGLTGVSALVGLAAYYSRKR